MVENTDKNSSIENVNNFKSKQMATTKTNKKKESTSLFNFFNKSTRNKSNSGDKSSSNNSGSNQQSSQASNATKMDKTKIRCQVTYLDETVRTFDLDKWALGQELYDRVCLDLELIEKEYFSLTYRDANNMKFWLDHDKKMKTQLKGCILDTVPVFNFEVKFYPPEPKLLQEDITRYLITLQLRHDIMDGKLPCSFVTHALLGSFTVQAEIGDYDASVHQTHLYLDGFFFAPNQTLQLLEAVAEYHKDHKGQTPEEAELHFLENAVKLAMYGVDLHNAKDSDGVDILLGVSASGLMVYRDNLRINRFSWPKILKISYKRNYFYLKLRAAGSEKYDATIGFRCPNHKAAKRLWKIAVEHHAFFRLREPEKPKKKAALIPNFNEKFRYTGSSTYMQTRQRSIERQQPGFTRSLSKRLTQSMDRMSGLTTPGANSLRLQDKSTLSIPNQMNLRESDGEEEEGEENEYEVNREPKLPQLLTSATDASQTNSPKLNDESFRAALKNDFKASTPILNKIQPPRYVQPLAQQQSQQTPRSSQDPFLNKLRNDDDTSSDYALSSYTENAPSFKKNLFIKRNQNIGPYSPARPSSSYKNDSTSSSPLRPQIQVPIPAERGSSRLNSSREMQREYEKSQLEAEQIDEDRVYQQRLLEEQRKNLELQQRRKLELQNLERRQRDLEAEREAQRRLIEQEEAEAEELRREEAKRLESIRKREELEAMRLKQLQQQQEDERLRQESIRRREELEALRLKQQQQQEEERLRQETIVRQQLRQQQQQQKQEEEIRLRLEQQQRDLEAQLARTTSRVPASNTSPIVSPNKPKSITTITSSTNHKDALLNAIRLATQLDPNFEVEKVEIKNGD